MKKHFIFLLILLSCSQVIFAQSYDKVGLYTLKEVILLQPVDFAGKNLQAGGKDEPPMPSKTGQQFRVLRVENGKALIQVLDYTLITGGGKNTEKKLTAAAENLTTKQIVALPDFFKYNFSGTKDQYNKLSVEDVNARSYGAYQRYFVIDATLLSDETIMLREQMVKGSLAAGVINFPFKLRPQKGKGDFSGAFNFGAGVGYRFSHKSWRKFTLSALSGYSISNVILDSSNTRKNQGQLASTNNFTAFSFSLGMLVEYERVQAGIFLGWDRIGRINQRQFEWDYQGKPWLSVGLGFSIFAGERASNTSNSTPVQGGL